jgi:hypothetical protein
MTGLSIADVPSNNALPKASVFARSVVGPSDLSVQWRPLEAVVAIQQRLAPQIGASALELVEKRSARR